MDNMEGGTIFSQLRTQNRLSEPLAVHYISEIILGLEALHSNKIIYISKAREHPA